MTLKCFFFLRIGGLQINLVQTNLLDCVQMQVNKVTNVKADWRDRGEGGAIVSGVTQLKNNSVNILEVNTLTSLHHYPVTLNLLNGHQAKTTLSAKVPIKMFTVFALRGGNRAAVGPLFKWFD